MKKSSHLGAYGLIINDDKIVLINKANGPYTGKLDLPGGRIEYGETPEQALIRELKEEVGIDIIEYHLFDANAVTVDWHHNEELEIVHHLGIFYKITKYNNELKEELSIDEVNDDSLGASYYDIKMLKKSNLSKIVILELEKLGYKLDKN
jgi:mutator protein MutT